MARATQAPTKITGGYTIDLEQNGKQRGLMVNAMSIDADFIPTLGMTMEYGRNLTEHEFEKVTTDSTFSFILNEFAVNRLGIKPEKAIGTPVTVNGRVGEIIGVVKDFHFNSMHEPIAPLVLFNEPWQLSYIFIKLKPGNTTENIASIKKIYGELVPHRPFEYTFLDDQYASLYANEKHMSEISIVFATLTIMIACLGLIGLVAYTASQKVKEIGIRKVMGASVLSIVMLITKDFSRSVIIAIAIGLPLSYYVMENYWLNTFAYRTDIGARPFIIAAVACLSIAFLSASVQAIKAALINPVDTLRND